ncbi:hypothetical protein [Paenisporosarcina sp. OV554]|uniref:hypothetical protein n=1 Tax=Paenisporosarcina sp. OV554 TaxID=2135694 RepID=UPI000D37FCBF|nr:hypothetical protein [Paenisporosarcina sp. OV554]PUB11142.1 hypothetical protein C8K15_11418 [Paenisporosarcina sp. OV554]
MAKLFHILVILCLISPSIIDAEPETPSVKVAFIKNGFLWIQGNDKIEMVTDKKASYSHPPQWSFDGKIPLYQKEVSETINENKVTQNELCIYEVETEKHRKIFYDLGFTPKWTYNQDFLGYIAGGGRIVFGFKNKNLKVTELPAYFTFDLTPKNYAEMGFTWVDDTSLIVSRVTESEWSNAAKKRPKPSLYFLTLTGENK